MFAIGEQVRLPHGRGVGLVVESHDGESAVFSGRRADLTPIVDRYVDCELIATGVRLEEIADLVRAELREPNAKGNWLGFAVTGA